MALNVEIKGRCGDLDATRRAAEELGFRSGGRRAEEDTFFGSHDGRLKLRDVASQPAQLISYRRLDSPLARPCDFALSPLADEAAPAVKSTLTHALGVVGTVRKVREVLNGEGAILNLDEVEDLGTFAKLEVEVPGGEDPSRYEARADELWNALGLEFADRVAWSYVDLAAMVDRAGRARAELKPELREHQVVLLDGASGTGKTTILRRVLEDQRYRLMPRHCTRPRREGVSSESEYVFVSSERFRALAAMGEFFEYRDFEFGMSYGLAWTSASTALSEGRSAIGVINLGNARHIKELFPEAMVVLIHADDDTIRRRLSDRGIHSSAQLEERLANARTVESFLPFYDLVVRNEDGRLDHAVEALRTFLEEREATSD
jgi:guanylate kinase/adenylate cyclase class IV